ncbi:hypothetical protein BD311DRAFT_245047 [Dichomitus squalens]|uniref:Uncharacterized protein n=1 Tax=Dichomitus squalens TaxID=114155 RepID=A0A4Q9M5K9_9APHY|nr:hypothetical protein BD311DRAFT_245047 [Dichomitus squalens]
MGFIKSELFDTLKNTLENFMGEIQNFGFVSNGSRIYSALVHSRKSALDFNFTANARSSIYSAATFCPPGPSGNPSSRNMEGFLNIPPKRGVFRGFDRFPESRRKKSVPREPSRFRPYFLKFGAFREQQQTYLVGFQAYDTLFEPCLYGHTQWEVQIPLLFIQG